MGYEDARSTKLLATHCLLCGLPLRDPISVESGIGPICAEKNGLYRAGNDETRAEVSKLIHSAAEKGTTAVQIFAIADKIEALGYPEVAEKIRTRFTRAYNWETGKNRKGGAAQPLIIKAEPAMFRGRKTECIWLHTPFEKEATPAFNSDFKDQIPSSGRTGEKVGNTFWWLVLPEHKKALHGLLLQHFDGRMCHGPKGSFIVGEDEKIAKEEAANATQDEALAIIERMKSGESIAAATAAVTASAPVVVEPVAAPAPEKSEEDWGDLD